MDSKLYTIEPSQRATSELERLVAGGPSAVRGAVGTEFTLAVGQSELRVRVRPALENETLSIQLDALDVPFELLVTVVYNARLRASSPPHDETQAEALALVLDHVDPTKEHA